MNAKRIIPVVLLLSVSLLAQPGAPDPKTKPKTKGKTGCRANVMADSGTRQGGSPVVPGAPTTKILENPPVPIPPPRLVVSGFSIEKPSGFVGSESVWRQKGRAPMSGWPTSSAAVNFTEVNPESLSLNSSALYSQSPKKRSFETRMA